MDNFHYNMKGVLKSISTSFTTIDIIKYKNHVCIGIHCSNDIRSHIWIKMIGRIGEQNKNKNQRVNDAPL